MLNFTVMITLHRLNGKEFVLNSDQIQYLEATPDTMLSLTNGEKLMVKESVEQVLELVKKFKKEIFQFPRG